MGPDFRCTDMLNYPPQERPPFHKATFSLQKGVESYCITSFAFEIQKRGCALYNNAYYTQTNMVLQRFYFYLLQNFILFLNVLFFWK